MDKFGRVCKEYISKEIAVRFKDYPNFFVTTFSHIGTGDIEILRKSFKKDSATYMVVKNSMLKQAMQISGMDKNFIAKFSPLISGPCGILFSKADPVQTARLLARFSKEHENLKIKGGFINGEILSFDTISLLADLPPKNVLLGMVVTGMKAPITGFVFLLNNLLRNLVGVLDAIGKKKSESQPVGKNGDS